MKKLITLLAMVLLVSAFAISASAAPEMDSTLEENLRESDKITEAFHECLQSRRSGDVDRSEQKEIIRELFLEAGWTEVDTAQEEEEALQANVSSETIELAYQDIEKADPAQKEKILEARSEVIYNRSWVNDQVPEAGIGYTTNAMKKEFSIDPDFSELFPGWEIPNEESDVSPVAAEPSNLDGKAVDEKPSLADSICEGLSAARAAEMIYFWNTDRPVSVAKKVPGRDSYPFAYCGVKATGPNTFRAVVAGMNSGLTSVNLGFTNGSNGANLAYKLNMGVGNEISYSCNGGSLPGIGLRASTYGTAGIMYCRATRFA